MRSGISFDTSCSIGVQPFGLLNSRNLYKWQVILVPFMGVCLYLQGFESTCGTFRVHLFPQNPSLDLGSEGFGLNSKIRELR